MTTNRVTFIDTMRGFSLFGIVLYSLQCIFSIVYLKKFKRGPIENILRIWTNWSWNGQIKIKHKGSTLHG
ncbi:DUF418 domain-containing protein [Viridibacillus sp. YIM B01967]|uniref:DUF418 domain-containing protein n=1 Tax=Viridibacillus soli TaxID=2798301 RepID=A0ABS1H9E8_9BACL|nr:DUF418 domain-containing protein [Viridibacillus soli]MBK3496030.1 DUF418 domain-containing protein [Viridibacillus soli]